MVTVTALDHFVINVRDVEMSAAGTVRVLGMTREEFETGPGHPKCTMLRFGPHRINVRPITATKEEWFTADHETPGSEDLCFLTGASPDAVVAHLEACGVAVEIGPVKRAGARGTLTSVYCRDPDGSLIEISSYAD